MNRLTRLTRFLALMLGLVAATGTVNAACTSPAGNAGAIVYASNANTLVFCNGTDWVNMAGWNGSGGGASTLSGLSDVNTTGAATGKILSYNGSQWVVSDSTPASSALGDRITSGTHAVTVNTSSGYVSLSTSGTPWGYFSAGTSYLPSLFTNSVSSTLISATNVSATLLQIGTGNGAVCDASRKGALRYSTTSSTVEYCNSSAWVSMGPSDTAPVSFFATKGGTNQTLTAATATKLTFINEYFDTNNNFASSRFTPTVAGKYIVNGSVYCQDATTLQCHAYIYKNGSLIFQGYQAGSSGTDRMVPVSGIVDMNGTTDYLELWGSINPGTIIGGNSAWTYFTASIIGPQNGGSGGSSTPAGSTNDVQYNNAGALAADTGNFTYSAGTLSSTRISATNISGTTAHFAGNVGIGTTSPNAKLEVRNRLRLSNSDFNAGSVGTFADYGLGATSGNTYTSMQAWNGGGSAYGYLALNPSGGFVGIGTVTPSTPLDLLGQLQINPINGYYTDITNNATFYSGAWRSAKGGPGSAISLQGGAQSGYTGAITFLTSASPTTIAAGSDMNLIERMRIDNAGNVGINTTSPFGKLDVSGSILIRGRDTTTGNASIATLSGGLGSPNAGDLRFGDGTGWKWHVAKASDNGATKFLTVLDNGNVGIGTATPNASLTVAGAISSTGEMSSNATTTQLGLGGGQFRAVYGNYGVIMRNDGSDFYTLMTASGSPYGSWNTLRPFIIGLGTGDVRLANNQIVAEHSTGVISTTGGIKYPDGYTQTHSGDPIPKTVNTSTLVEWDTQVDSVSVWRFDWIGTGGGYKVQISTNGGTTWVTIGSTATAREGLQFWVGSTAGSGVYIFGNNTQTSGSYAAVTAGTPIRFRIYNAGAAMTIGLASLRLIAE